MKLKLRIFLLRGDRKLSKKDIEEKDNFWVGVRYILEFRYLEASKWLLLSEDSKEKYLLLSLINLALGDKERAMEYVEYMEGFPSLYDISVKVDNPHMGIEKDVKDINDIMRLVELIF